MTFTELILKALGQVLLTLQHNWPFLAISVIVAAAFKLYVNQDLVATFLRRNQRASVLAATTAAVATPLCSCGTMAVVLGMMAGSMPWAPIVAFMVASPLTSPEELFYSAGLFGWPFALAFFAASIVLGLLGGVGAHFLEARGWLANQVRLQPGVVLSSECGCRPAPQPVVLFEPDRGCQKAYAPQPLIAAFGCETSYTPMDLHVAAARPRLRIDARSLLHEIYLSGRRLTLLFLAFAFVGYLLNDLIPSGWITALFGGGHVYSVPLAATLGLPFYLNSEASLPLVSGLLRSGMSSGAALAFLITGAGTSIGALAGALTIARWRVIGLVVATLWTGAVACGLAYDAILVAVRAAKMG